VVRAQGAAPFAHLYARYEQRPAAEDASVELTAIKHPQTLASAIRIGAPVSWQKAWREIMCSRGRALSVKRNRRLADAKAIIGRDGVGCEPASATTVAGIQRLVAQGVLGKDESVWPS